METLIFQSLIFSVARKFNLKDSLIIFLSTILFASIHYYNLAYFLVIVFSGFFTLLLFHIYRSGKIILSLSQ
ncbi:CPBP family intramembrane metalloprotease [Sphingobacterium kitahiroshimense]|nr:CPBP family intramembrane metalloprotease [Sphingobacterium sp. B16(2022)]